MMIRRPLVAPFLHHQTAGWAWACLLILAALPLRADAPEVGSIVVVAGLGGSDYMLRGYLGDGGPAVRAMVRNPGGLTVDGSGDLLITDRTLHRVREVTPDGTIATVAGNSGPYWLSHGFPRSGFSGDGGPAIRAMLSSPGSVAVDRAGNLYIADVYNWRVRKVNSAGIISTVAGAGRPGSLGDGGSATQAALSGPAGIALDSHGDLFIVELGASRVRKVTPEGTISTVAGGGTGGLGDGGPATAARLQFPSRVAVDGAGDLFIADRNHHRVRKVNPKGIITTVAGTGAPGFSGDGGPAIAARLNMPTDLALDQAGSLFVLDSYNHRVREISPSGTITTVAGGGRGPIRDGISATAVALDPVAMTVDAAGNLFIADRTNRVLEVPGAAARAVPSYPAEPAESSEVTR